MDDDRESEDAQVYRWREDELARAGYPTAIAERIARTDADLHRACEMATNGCPHDLALEILT